jgi:hypothetical protein
VDAMLADGLITDPEHYYRDGVVTAKAVLSALVLRPRISLDGVWL